MYTYFLYFFLFCHKTASVYNLEQQLQKKKIFVLTNDLGFLRIQVKPRNDLYDVVNIFCFVSRIFLFLP